MSSSNRTKPGAVAERPLSERIEQAQETADRLRQEQREQQDEAQRLAQEKAARERQARQAWSEAQLGRLREIFAATDRARAEAVTAFMEGWPDSDHYWYAWRDAAKAAAAEWGVIASTYEQSHADDGLLAPRGRSFLGTGPDTFGETLEEFKRRLIQRRGDAVAARTRARVLAELAAAVGAADVAEVEASITRVARFYRGRADLDMSGKPTGEVRPWPGRHPSQPVNFGPGGLVDVYDKQIAAALDADPTCVRVPLDGPQTEP